MKKALFILVLIILSAAIIAYTVMENPHGFSDSECSKCHVDAGKTPKELVAPVIGLCAGCHRRGMKTASHPVGILPGITRIPQGMPLENGRLTCNTCHNIHAKRFTAFGEKSYFLRTTARGRDFCAACHTVDPLLAGHKELLDAAHMGRRYTVTDASQSIDGLSLECLSCHDSSVGSLSDYIAGAGYWEHLRGPHPIGVNYETSRRMSGGLKPASRLSKKIRFFDGRIGCGTCHDPFSGLSAQLVMDNTESRLCSECHFDK
ncbi:MAG: cytochrome c3 family protein [Thermodesulfovibrionales bacterium]|nr:cytochrome c3 family protein [Thermodesulfovibrionales bacterium]